ncbi:p74 [Cnaphalocrocis medinalis granulovirus]|uniref:P74 n=1 Tax=Cnaphalocrocis medinalis granulovirus TaxID=1750712 RepID=A0A120L1G2_9BBAC|nr:p74 [Cnaphalocrocis medinalis granulovirus]AMF83779.1 p74 [Cnaphalocrocis medinalis granulovirus]
MATPTSVDLVNAVKYLTNREQLSLIVQWRARLPHILIDYTIRWAHNEDYYVPPMLRQTSGIVTHVTFSREGCDAMSCYPYTATGVIDFVNTPIGGYTQTSNTSVQYNQPACFHLDPALASRDNNIQSVELRYTQNNKCILVDTFTKAWMNTPYLRTSKHVVSGIDDVPGFDVQYDSNPLFPERIVGRFNEAYCRRFGRHFTDNNSCSRTWFETFVSFILGDSIYNTFKLLGNNVFDDLRNFNYERPSAVLPPPPEPEGDDMLHEWLLVRDTTHDANIEKKFLSNDFGDMLRNANDIITYVANKGFTTNYFFSSKKKYDYTKDERFTKKLNDKYFDTKTTDSSLESVIVNFLDDHALIMSILFDLGFDVLESVVVNMMQQLNKVLMPSLRRMLLMQSRRVTVALLGETYKAAMVHALNRALISTIGTVAKALSKAVTAAASLVNIALLFFLLADLVLMIWDPFGYNNMFPRGFLDDLSNSFLSSYYESLESPTRDAIEFLPIHFTNLLMNDDEEDYFVESMMHIIDYLAALDVNSNGQMIDLQQQGDAISEDNFDEQDLLGASLATNDTWAYFRWFCARHDAIVTNATPFNNMLIGIGVFTSVSVLFYYIYHINMLDVMEKKYLETLLTILVVLIGLLLVLPSLQYYTQLMRHNQTFT